MAQVVVECLHCRRNIAQAQLGRHMRAMHPETLNQTGNGATAPPPVPRLIDDDGIVWEEPPTHTRGLAAQLEPIVVKLRRQPGRWARVRECDGRTSANTQVKKARELFGDCEFRAGPHGDGSALWGRAVDPA